MCGLEDEAHQLWHHLNESPSQKEGKSPVKPDIMAYMRDLNESPSQKEGKYVFPKKKPKPDINLNESPSQKEGKFRR